MPRSTSIPKPYTKSGRLAVCLRDRHTGRRRTVYLGAAGTPEARRKYARVLAEWEAGDRGVAPPQTAAQRRSVRRDEVAIAEMILRYHRGYVKRRHADEHAELTSHGRQIRDAMRILREQSGDLVAAEFGPRALRRVRESMADSVRFGRKIVNRYTEVLPVNWALIPLS